MGQDILIVLRWWTVWVGLGLVGWPAVRKFLGHWEGQGYWLAKTVGGFGVTFVVWALGVVKVVPFTQVGTWVVGGLLAGIGWRWVKNQKLGPVNWRAVVRDELIFGGLLLTWAWVKAHEPTINGLEKFMDYGFARSAMQGKFFPPADMWFAGESINYYYFGHLMMAVATKLSGLNLAYTFNLMLATIFALCATMSLAIGRHLLRNLSTGRKWVGAILVAFLVTLSGNLQTIYAFTKGYAGSEDNPPPFWKILVNPLNPVERMRGWNSYWYPNATRFIPYTIHEFPGYSFVVSDIHGHVLSIPIVLLLVALLINIWQKKEAVTWGEYTLYGVAAGWAFMTNALDGPIYLGLFAISATIQKFQVQNSKFQNLIAPIGMVILAFGLTILPFVINFQPFVTGVAINCPPAALANSKIGPIVFEGAEKCQRSPAWMLLILWGFFLFNAVALAISKNGAPETKRMFWVWAVFCLGLILFAEFFYFKDIYPLHFRSNTMFKLGYQAFILMSILSGYAIIRIIFNIQYSIFNKIYLLGLASLLYLVVIYPLFSVKSYFGKLDLANYKGLYGLTWMQERLPDDWAAVRWFEENIKAGQQPVILEANGDSYTDYDRVSTFTGLPTVAGWTVHEWLWRGSYEPIAARAEEVRQVYEAVDVASARAILAKYEVKYIVVGGLERQKYVNLSQEILEQLGVPVFTSGSTTVYKIT